MPSGQYCQGDNEQIVHQPGEGEALTRRSGASAARLLFQNEAERVAVEDWEPSKS